MGASSRRKGKSGELEVCALLHEAGLLEARRTPNSGGLAWRGDVQGVDGYLIEVKRCETVSVPAWLRQAYAAAGAGEVPVIIFRRSKTVSLDPTGDWHAILPARELARLIAFEANPVLPRLESLRFADESR